MTQLCGAYRGIVVDDEDPGPAKRVRVQIPGMATLGVGTWATTCLPVGSKALPGVGQEVWILFERGDSRLPVCIGVKPAVAEPRSSAAKGRQRTPARAKPRRAAARKRARR